MRPRTGGHPWTPPAVPPAGGRTGRTRSPAGGPSSCCAARGRASPPRTGRRPSPLSPPPAPGCESHSATAPDQPGQPSLWLTWLTSPRSRAVNRLWLWLGHGRWGEDGGADAHHRPGRGLGGRGTGTAPSRRGRGGGPGSGPRWGWGRAVPGAPPGKAATQAGVGRDIGTEIEADGGSLPRTAVPQSSPRIHPKRAPGLVRWVSQCRLGPAPRGGAFPQPLLAAGEGRGLLLLGLSRVPPLHILTAATPSPP